jgi:hypothetical protein
MAKLLDKVHYITRGPLWRRHHEIASNS